MPENVSEISVDSPVRLTAVWAVAALALGGAAFAAVWGTASTAATGVDTKEAAEMTVTLAPANPDTHGALAELLELSFEPADFDKALTHYEIAAALSPFDYLRWQELGRARERRGDAEGAEAALRIAAKRAPHYASVAWVLGNNLLRQGRAEEAFAEISRAVAADPRYTGPAADLAWRIFDGDLPAIRASIGDSPRLTAAIAVTLAEQERYDESLAQWSSIPDGLRAGELADTGEALAAKFYSAKRYRAAIAVGGSAASVGAIGNPGFEAGIRAERPGRFEWSIGKAVGVQVVPTNGRRRSGANSLAVVLTNAAGGIKILEQVAAVEPGAAYRLTVFFQGDLKGGGMKWSAVDARDGAVLGAAEVPPAASDWTELTLSFTAPLETDGVRLVLGRDACKGSGCAATGTVWFDDLELIKQ